MTAPEKFLDPVLGKLFGRRKAVPPRRDRAAYNRLRAWCKSEGIALPTRDLGYYDFADSRIGTIGAGDGAHDDYEGVLEIARYRIESGNPEATMYDVEEDAA
jgi:hypothetical protein